jgi:SAM-dependent methyltransferase
VLWDSLVEGWQLEPPERCAIERQQGLHCVRCGTNLQSMALAAAISSVYGVRVGMFRMLALLRPYLRVLEVNTAGHLHRVLKWMPRHQLVTYPEVDFMKLPTADQTFDLVVHSETLEHVPDPTCALAEAHRVLRPGGFTCYTVPYLLSRLTRRTEGRPPTYHGSEAEEGYEGLRVATEYGADFWSQPLAAGFAEVRLFANFFPDAVALAARRSC